MFGFWSFSEAPFSSQALNDYQLQCSAGSYAITGGDATFTYTRTLAGSSGSYVITGYAATLAYNYVIDGQAGSYAITGSNADLTFDKVLEASNGSYSLTGYSASFVYNQVIYAGSFAFTWTGNDAGLYRVYTLTAQPGAYSITGNAATFVRGTALNCSTGHYLISGKDADLVYTPIPVVVTESKGGIDKKRKKYKAEKESREELEAIVKREFDILDGTYQPEAVEVAKDIILPKIKEIDYTEYAIALAQVNALLLQAKIQAAEYEAELDDEEALLMLL